MPKRGGAASGPTWGRSLAWIKSGLLAGALAGALDAVSSIAGGIGGLSGGKAVRLTVLAASLMAATGALVGLVVAVAGSIARRTRAPARSAAVLAALGAAPLIVYDAVSLFTGHRSASVPAHGAISAAFALGALVAVGWGARVYGAWLARDRIATTRTWMTPLALLAVGVVCQIANRLVLPRLYQWFHLSLAAATLLAFLLAVRLLTRGGRAAAVGLLAAATAIASVASIIGLGHSQGLRYAAYERTALTALALRVLPAARRSHPVGAGGPRAGEADLPPLPAGPRRPQADVLLITIDALRYDHVGAYGYARHTTPHIDQLAAEGTRFSRVYSQAPHTSFSVSSMLTSKYFPGMARLAPGERHDTIASVLRNYGWKTAAFYPPAVFFIDSDKLKTFAETNFDFEYVKFEFIDAQRRVDQLLAYYDTVNPGRSFVWVHFFEPHEPYVAHEGFPFGSGDLDRYDSEIAYTDAAVGRLVKEVRARRPGTIVIVAADHGEEFDEHGGRYHGSSLYEEQLRIPLIISIPGVPPHVVDGQVELFDVTPTVLNLLDISVPVRMRGTDLGPWLAMPPAPAARLPPAFAELEDKRMVSVGGEKLICDMRLGFCSYFDLTADPHERHNLAEERPDRVAALHGLLDGWLDAHLQLEPTQLGSSSSAGSVTAGAGGSVPKALERGRLGDLAAAPELAALMISAAPVTERREAAELLVGLPPQPETATALARAAADPDGTLADWAAVGSLRVGDGGRRARVVALVGDGKTAKDLRVRAALALATAGDGSGIPVLAEALDRRDDIPLCRFIIVTLGKLGDRRAVPILLAHLPEVQNRREMVEALGALGARAAVPALVETLRHDAYVPVRAAAATSLAQIGVNVGKSSPDRRLIAVLSDAARHDTEPMVASAARAAAESLKARP
ncbi:MAG TPA: sulfatase-like hydrolase/transferase [Polyangia bacterium]|nr:sulfatase-like hydrolase/transferase [Polyangia bacterium]